VANFLPPDSVMQRLMALPGFSITRYQGEIITFQAATRGAALTNRAIVQRDSQIVKSDTIVYSGESSGVQAIGKRNVFVVPGQAAPIVTTGAANYDMASAAHRRYGRQDGDRGRRSDALRERRALRRRAAQRFAAQRERHQLLLQERRRHRL
jgi:hypothetical protein